MKIYENGMKSPLGARFLSLGAQDSAKLIFFENLFYMVDADSNGLIHVEDAFLVRALNTSNGSFACLS